MLGRNKDAALEWELPVTVSGEPSQTNEGFVQLKNSISSTLPLLCRYQSYKNEVSAESVSAKNKEPGSGLLLSLLFAFIGGVLLNLMPCVLPIISIKLVGFVQRGEQPRREALSSALFFSSGIIFSFLSLALVVTLLRGANQRIGWGFQFQHPEFVLSMIVVVFLLALGFFDIYTVSLPFMRQAERRVSALRHRFLKSFFEGVLTTALSTPCTAPFLGTALVYAFTQEAVDTFLIFLAVGLGLSMPYVILSTNRRFLSLLPKPGAWMTRFKELMGFLLLGTIIWLLYVLHRSSPEAVIWTLALLLLILFTFWAYGWAVTDLSKKSRWIVALVFCSILLWFVSQLLPFVERPDANHKIAVPSGSLGWEEYSPEHVNALLSQGRTVFLNFTADWCLTCKANELLVLRRNEVKRIFAEFNVAPVKADWTNGNEEITAALERYGAKGVPLYVVLAPDNSKEPLVLGTLLTVEKVREAVRQTALK
jgi:thiol:disulfide interchange protein DsbD